MDAIHSSFVLGWVKHADIAFPHVHAFKPTVCDPFPEDVAAVVIPLNSDNWLVSENEVSEDSPASSCEEVHCSKFTLPFHISCVQIEWQMHLCSSCFPNFVDICPSPRGAFFYI